MAKSFGKLTATVSADSTEFKKGLNDASKEAQSFQEKVTQQLDSIKLTTSGMTGVFTTLGAGLVINELKNTVQETVNTAVELERLSNVAGVSTDEFQKLSFGAQKLGMDSEKLSDILKDVNEKFGESIATGSGPLKDFFDVIAPKVGVTAEQFRKLSGPEALQLYYDSLQKANVSQKETTFYMEALVSDGSKLIPMLKNSGEGFKAAAAEAERLGLVMSKSAIEEAKRLDSQMKILEKSMQGFKTGVGLSVIPALNDIINFAQRARAEYGLLGAAIAAIGGTVLTLGGVELDDVKRAKNESTQLFSELSKNNSEIDRYKKQISDGLGFKSVLEGNIKSLEEENIEIKKKLKERNDIVNADARVKGLASQQQRIADKIKKDAEDKAAAENQARLEAEKNKKSGGGTKSPAKKEDKPQQDPIDQLYLKTLDEIKQKTIELDSETQGLSATEKKLALLRASPEFALMPERMQQEIELGTLELVGKEKLADTQKKINELLRETPTEKLKEQKLVTDEINSAYKQGNITLKERNELLSQVDPYQANAKSLYKNTESGKLEENKKQKEGVLNAYNNGAFGEVGSAEAMQKYRDTIKQVDDEAQKLEGTFIDISSAVDNTAASMAQSFIDFTTGTQISFSKMTQSILADLAKMIVRQQIFNALKMGMKAITAAFAPTAAAPTGAWDGATAVSASSGGYWANGGAFQNGAVIPFANGGIFDSPITFPMAGGKTGLMGEAGPEGIFPLTRINGKLGVNATGLGNTNVINQVSVTVNADKNSNADEIGAKTSEAVIRALAKQEIQNATRYGGLLSGR